MSDNNVKEIEDLIKIISRLPGLGPKSAKRIVLKLIKNREELIKPLTNTLAQVYKNVVRCNICGNLKSLSSSCICSNKKYDQICVVENIADMWVIQSSGIYNGHYHILGGTLPSPDIQTQLETKLHLCRELLAEAYEAEDKGNTGKTKKLISEILMISNNVMKESQVPKK